MKEFLEYIDMNGVGFNLTFNSKNRFKTQFGGGLTLIYIFIVSLLIISNYIEVKNKSSLNVTSYSTQIANNSLINYSNFFFGIGFKTNSQIINNIDYIDIQAKQFIPDDNSIRDLKSESCKDEKFEGFFCLNLTNTVYGRELSNSDDRFVYLEYSFDYGKFLKDSNFEDNPVEIFLYLPLITIEPEGTIPVITRSTVYKILDFRKYIVNFNRYTIHENNNKYDTFSVTEVKEVKGFKKGLINLHINNLMTVYKISSYTLQEAMFNTFSLGAIFFIIINSIGKIYNSYSLKEQFMNDVFIIVDKKREEDSEAIKIDMGKKDMEEGESNDEDSLHVDKNSKVKMMNSEKDVNDKINRKTIMKKFVDYSLKFRIFHDYLCCKKVSKTSFNLNNNLTTYMKEAAFYSFTDVRNIIKKLEKLDYLKKNEINPFQNHMLNKSKIHLNLSFANFDHFNNDENYINEFLTNNFTDENTKNEKSQEYLKQKIDQNDLTEMEKFVFKKISF